MAGAKVTNGRRKGANRSDRAGRRNWVTPSRAWASRGARQIGRLWRSIGRARFNALALAGAFIALVTLGAALAIVTHPGAPGPLVINAPTATPEPLFQITPTLDAFPTTTLAPAQGNGFGDTTPNAPIISAPGSGAPVPNICPTPSSAPTATAQTPTATSGNGCTPCGVALGGNPDQAQIRSALATAANVYRLPHNLLFAVAWEESSWHEDIISCSGGIGLTQIQGTTYSWLNQQSVPACQIGVTDYDPFTLEGNADLGAKYLKYLSCFYSYWGADANTTLSAPGAYTAAWYYQQAKLPYPDSADPNSLCASAFHARSSYADLPATVNDPWSCPFSAQPGDYTLLDLTLSAYNQGAGNTDRYGVQNLDYVRAVEALISSFASGALP